VKVDVRVMCASNKNLRALVGTGAFRMDLFYRVNVISIEVPPLRDRIDDVPLLVAHSIAEVERQEGIVRRLSESAMNEFRRYNWPGNVRELRNVLRRAMVTCPRRTIVRKDVVPFLTGGQTPGFLGEDLDRTDSHIILRLPRRSTYNEIIDECERIVLSNALKECHWNKSKVVSLLKIPRQSLYNKIEKYGLHRKWE
jgi:DNA-binding NtrC family response regulator